MTKKELEALIAQKADEVKKGFATEPVADAVVKSELVDVLKSNSDKPEVKAFQSTCDDLLVLNAIMKCKEDYAGVKSTKLYKRLQSQLQSGSELSKALTTGGSTTGAEWIPTGWSSQLQGMIDLELKVAPQFPTFSMPQSPYEFPVQTSHATAYKIAEMGEVTASTPATNKITFTAAKLATQVQASYEMEEDSIIAVLPMIKSELALSIARGIDNVLVNGCADNSIDSDNSTASDQRRAIVGLRKLAIANAYTTDLSTFNGDTIGPMRKKLGKYYEPSKCCWIVSTSVYEQLTRLKDASGNALVITMDKLGNDATIKQGVLGQIFGSDIVLSEFVAANLNASGIYDASVTTKTGMLLVRKDAFKFATHGNVITESFRVIDYQYTKLVTSRRIAFNPMFAIASNHVVDFGINITA